MNRRGFKTRFVRLLFVALGAVYALTSVVFLSTGNPGGVSLGLLFLGGVALLYVSVRLLDELQRIRQHFSKTQQGKEPSTSSPESRDRPVRLSTSPSVEEGVSSSER